MMPWDRIMEEPTEPHCPMCWTLVTEENSYLIPEKLEDCEEKEWIDKIWVRLGFGGERVCCECYYK